MKERIMRVCIDYHQVMITSSEEEWVPSYEQDGPAIYQETLVIDRRKQAIEHSQSAIDGSRSYREYVHAEAIVALLDELDVDTFFTHVTGNPSDVIESAQKRYTYQIMVEYDIRPPLIIEGTYDKLSLPDDYGSFIEGIFNCVRYFGFGEIFNTTLYGRAKRREGDYICLSVIFPNSIKSYYYLSDDETIQVGDIVYVPAGVEDEVMLVQVVDIEYFGENTAPYPIDKMKWVIRKCTEEELEQFMAAQGE